MVSYKHRFKFHVVLLYLGTIVWVFAYDTIYSLQDVRDDIKIKVNSTALTFGANTKIAVGGYFIAFIFFINVSWTFSLGIRCDTCLFSYDMVKYKS